LGKVGALVSETSFLFALAFFGVETTAVQLGVPLHMLMLRHIDCVVVVVAE
jgi:hypothetical protein